MGSWRRRGRGGLIGSPAPGGSGTGPAQLGEQLRSALRPWPPLPRPQAGNVLFPPLPPRGQRAGRAGWRPTLFSSPPRCEPEPPPPLPPLTHAAPGLARRRVWDGVRGWGALGGRAPSGGRALLGRAPPAATWSEPPRASQPPQLVSGAPLPRQRANSFLISRWERGLRACGKGVLFPAPC